MSQCHINLFQGRIYGQLQRSQDKKIPQGKIYEIYMVSEFEIFPLKWTKKRLGKKISYQSVSFSMSVPGGATKDCEISKWGRI